MRNLQKIYGNPPEKKDCFRKLYENEGLVKNKSPYMFNALKKKTVTGFPNKFPKIS